MWTPTHSRSFASACLEEAGRERGRLPSPQGGGGRFTIGGHLGRVSLAWKDRVRRGAPPSLTLPHKGGGNGEVGGRGWENTDDHHPTPPIRSSRVSMPRGPWVAATISPPPARCSRIRPANIAWPATS